MANSKVKLAENAIRKIAKRDGVSVEYVRGQMKIAMLNGLCSTDPKAKVFWDSVPHKGQVPTPENFILHTSGFVKKRSDNGV
jgi:hypothetical protein